MATVYRSVEGGVDSMPFNHQAIASDSIWIDALQPDDDELARLGELLGFELPNRHDMTEIELSSRLYREAGAHVMIANLLPKSETEVLPPRPAAFVLKEKMLVTVRYCEFFSFERVAGEILREHETRTPQSVFTSLLDEAVSDRADNIEFSMRRMEELTARLFQESAAEAEGAELQLDLALLRIGGMGERVSNIRESIASLQRVLNYAATYVPEAWMHDQIPIMESMRKDLEALADEVGFFMNKLAFNLDATLGMINIDETKIIRLLSIVTLLLSPPTLIAGIYGMNFRIMPELDWPFGYLFALLLMIGTSTVSIWYLKRKRWF